MHRTLPKLPQRVASVPVTMEPRGQHGRGQDGFPAYPRAEFGQAHRRARWVSRPNFGVRLETSEGDHVLLLGEMLLVGRGSFCDIVIHDSSVSKVHLLLEILPGAIAIATDLNSRNGVKIDGKYVDRVLLHPGEELHVGRAWMRLVPLRMDSDGAIRADHRSGVDSRIEELLREPGHSRDSTVSDR
ncbi:MAG: FHA domain-containing protein [Fibrobacterota bacterium]|nr:FHA domain-containing protein [Fibrobacterota bacterium]QQS06753.1 MAG: FHA domain-containing protein [Fibrobacterota bacterium]